MGRLLLAAMALLAAVIFAPQAAAQPEPPPPATEASPAVVDPSLGETRRRELIDKLKHWEAWYTSASNSYGSAWHIITTLVVVLTAATSLLVALDKATSLKWLAVLMPAAAGLLTTISVQFRIKENWQLREFGRLEIASLLVDAHDLRADDPELRRKANDLLRKALAIDRAQAASFFDMQSQKQERGAQEGRDGRQDDLKTRNPP